MRASRLLAAAAAAALALPVLAQDVAPGQPQNAVTPAPAPSPTPTPSPAPAAGLPSAGGGESETGLVELDLAELPPPPPPVEYPDHARRDERVAGRLDPVGLGLGASPWKAASGAFLSTLMRRMDTPLASRWAHIALRNALIARIAAPRHVNPVDWTAERAWLLLRMGEADGARMLIAGVDTDAFTPKMTQVAVQSALANADPSGLCPLQEGLPEVEPNIVQLVDAMCAALAGEPEAAAEQIDSARRRGRMRGIDLELAQKVVGAGSNTGRAVTIEWEPVDRLDTWRFGLATATGMTFPERLIEDAPAQLRAWQAAAPLIAPEDRLESAEIATGLGVFSGQALTDLHALIYDATGPDELPETMAWQLRLAFLGSDVETRLAAMRRLWGRSDDPLRRMAALALTGRAASLVQPDPELQSDAPDLIAAMLAAGFDREAARWAQAVSRMDDGPADEAWAMLALGAPDRSSLDLSLRRINAFIGRDTTEGKKRSALLVAGLVGLGRIDAEAAGRLSGRHGLRLGHRSNWTRMIDQAAAFRQSGTVLVLAGTGLQAASFLDVPPAHVYHAVAALKATGLEYTARMIASEALART
ncbi:MAG TPA: hypothetical protein VFK58_03465 [Sphingomicrobium sp.]|nr:hypothetical protein [Sphingomicrobium sp.]